MTHIHLGQLSLVSAAAVVMFLFVAGTFKGLVAIGMPIVAVPLLNLVLDLPATVALLSIPLVLTNIPQALAGDPLPVVAKRLTPVFGGLVVGVFAGISLLAGVHPALLKPLVGALLCVIALMMLLAPRVKISKRLEPVTSPIAGMVGGLAGGLAALPGPFVFMYLLALGIERDRFVQYSSLFLTVAATLMTLMLGGKGLMGWGDSLVSALATLPILAGMWVGGHVRQFVSADMFRKITLGVIVIGGAHLMSGAFH